MKKPFFVERRYRTNPKSHEGHPNIVLYKGLYYDSIENPVRYFNAIHRYESESVGSIESLDYLEYRSILKKEILGIVPDSDELTEYQCQAIIAGYKYRNELSDSSEDIEQDVFDYESYWHDEMYKKSKRKSKERFKTTAI